MDFDHNGTDKKLLQWRLPPSDFNFEVFYQIRVKHHAANVLSGMPTTGMDESPLEDNVPVLLKPMSSVKAKFLKPTQNLLPTRQCNDHLDTVRPKPHEDLEV